MKTLSANTETALDAPGISIVRLCEITLSGLTLRLCDRVFGAAGSECVYNGAVYEPLVISWGAIRCGEMRPPFFDTQATETDLVIDNNTPVGGADRFVGLLADYDLTFADLKIFEIFEGADAAGDAVDIFAGHIEDLINMDQPRVTLSVTGFSAGLSPKFAHDMVDADTYPSADPDDIGKMLPQVYGSARRVPMMAIDVGPITRLAEAVGADDVIFELTGDIDRFSASGTAVIDSEEITWTGKSGKQLTGITRGANSTEAVAHKWGAMIGEKKSEYVFALGHAIKAINDVYVADVRQMASEYTVYTGQSGDEHVSHPGMGCVVFDELSKILTADPTSLSNNTGFALSRRVAGLPIGYIKAVDKNGVVADFDDTTTITFPDSPSGTLSEIVVNYYFELRTLKLFSSSGKIPKGGLPFYIDGQKVAYVDEAGDLVQETSSPLKVPKDSWPASAEKTKTWRHSGYGTYALIIQKAEITCVSTVSELEQQGKTVEKEASSLPVGAHTSQTTVDDSASVSFPAAPSGNLSDIVIEVRWALTITGDRITSDKPRVYSIGGQPVKILGQTLSYNLMAGTIYLPQSAWQTSIAKTKSRLDEFGRGEEFVILSAVQRCRTDDFSADYELSGNSMADAKLGGRVSADVDGFLDDGSGTITGTAGALIERPDHIAEHMLTDRCGLAAARIDATAYAAAGSTYNTEGYKLAFPILQPPSLPKLLNRVAHQAKSVQFWAAGVHKLVYAADAPSVDKIIYEHMIDLGQIWVKRTNRADIVNTATARYARDWSGFSDDREADRKTVTKTDSASVTKYGTLYGDERSYPYIPEGSEAQAQDVLDWEVSRRAAQKLVIEFAGGYFLTALEPGDVVQFSFDSGSALDNALLNLVTSETDKFRVIDRRDRSDAAKQFEMIEI